MSSPCSNENLLQRKYMFLEESIERNAEKLFMSVHVSKMPSKLLQIVDSFHISYIAALLGTNYQKKVAQSYLHFESTKN